MSWNENTTSNGDRTDAPVGLLDLVRGRMTRLTLDAANDNMPVWSPDGREE